MKNRINIAALLKDCPRSADNATPLYCSLLPCEDNEIFNCNLWELTEKRIVLIPNKERNSEDLIVLKADGTFREGGECLLFPSKEIRDWNYWRITENYIKIEVYENIDVVKYIVFNQRGFKNCLYDFHGISNDIKDKEYLAHLKRCALNVGYKYPKKYPCIIIGNSFMSEETGWNCFEIRYLSE